jgi:hypothetical protein
MGTWIETVFWIHNNSTIIRVVLWRLEFMNLGLITILAMGLYVRALNLKQGVLRIGNNWISKNLWGIEVMVIHRI